MVSSGGCDVQDDYVNSRTYPRPHGNDESCSIAINQDVDVGVGVGPSSVGGLRGGPPWPRDGGAGSKLRRVVDRGRRRETEGDIGSLLLGVFRASTHEQETLGAIGSNRKS